jgi:hypothetical protein
MGQRFPKQPWTYDFKDLIPVGDPETVICLPCGSLLGLHVVGLEEGDKMIGIRCDELGRPETCAVTNEIAIDHQPLNIQSNPHRYDESDPA